MKKFALLAALLVTVLSAPSLVQTKRPPLKPAVADGGSPMPLCNPYTEVCPKVSASTT